MSQPEGQLSKELNVLVDRFNEGTGEFWRLRPTFEAVQEFVRQWGVFTRHSRQCWGSVVGNCPVVEVRRFIVAENLYEEEGDVRRSHYEKLVRLGLKSGLKRQEIDEAEPIRSTRLALLVWEALTKHRSWMEGLGAKAVLEAVGFPELRRIRLARYAEALPLSEADLEFFSTHITADETHYSGAYGLLERFVPTGDYASVITAADDSLGAMAVFCNGIGDAMRKRGAVV